jgi:UDP-3-O-[3-hydroxymyristoyl] glucosamine N-acyltransferase
MPVKASEIAAFLGKPLMGDDVLVTDVKSFESPASNALSFAKKYTPELAATFNAVPGMLLIAVPEYEGKLSIAHILTPEPRLDFARVLRKFFAPAQPTGIAPTAVIASSAQLGNNVSIGHFSIIGEHVTIGDNTRIGHHVIIHDQSVIGQHCLIKSNTVIGEEGFGFEFEEDGTPIRIPHLGRVILGDYVEIGALNSIVRGTLENTVLANHVKTDDHVFIAHNVTVGENTVIIAGAEISGSVRIGKNVWIAPQASVINQAEIGDEAMIGIGAVVTKSVAPNMIVVGNPAKELRKRYER